MKNNRRNYPGPRGAWSRHPGFGPGFGPGGPPFGGPPFGPGGRGRGRGRNRGDIRAAVLLLLSEQSRHGYDLIRAIEERTDHMWSPSPGSIYPTLQALEDEGLVLIDSVDGRKVASLTESGRDWVAAHEDEVAAVFERPQGQDGALALRDEVMALRDAVIHVGRQQRDPERVAKATEIIANARKEIYRLMAE